MWSWTAPQPGSVDVILLVMERRMTLDQQVGDLSSGDADPDMREPLGDFRLGHLAPVIEDQR